jgi:hypothetical protein
MKLVIDDKQCLKHKLSPQEVLIAIAIRSSKDSIKSTIDNMLNREIIVSHEGKLSTTQHWDEEIDTILVDSAGAIDDEDRLNALADKMKQCFPEGKMPGTPYYYRCNKREIVLKLKKFFSQYGNYKDEDMVDATKRFVASFSGNYRYLPLIKYFIMKNKTVADEDGSNHIVECSPLADYLENKEDDNVVTASDEWLMNARN